MIITAEEKLMYAVMKAIYDSGIPINFKGSMVLKACLLEAGYNEETRHTVDIDANWISDTEPTAEHMVASLQKALFKSGIDLNVRLYRMYGEKRSAGFKLIDASIRKHGCRLCKRNRESRSLSRTTEKESPSIYMLTTCSRELKSTTQLETATSQLKPTMILPTQNRLIF